MRRRVRLWMIAAGVVVTFGLLAGGGAAASSDEPLAPPGLDITTRTWDVVVADFDGDEHDDVLITRHGGSLNRDVIRYWRPDGFEEGFELPGVDRHGCDAADVNGDGRVDLYCMLGAELGTIEKANELWIQQEDGSFVDRAAAWRVADPLGRGRRPLFFDFNGDPLPDLYLTNAPDRPDGRPSVNRLFVNQGTRFLEVPTAATGNPGALCAVAGDIDRDGWQDLITCGTNSHVFRNDGGTGFTDVSYATLGGKPTWSDVALADLDGDGWLDLAVAAWSTAEIRYNRGDVPVALGTQDRTFTMQDARFVAAGDFVADSSPDVYLVGACEEDGNTPDLLLRGPAWWAVPTPQATEGCGGGVANLENSVLVLNGHLRTKGPIQVIEMERGEGPFVDDDPSVFLYDIEWAAETGLTMGCNPPANDRFCPERSVTRGEMAAFLVRFLDVPAPTRSDRFVDDDASVFEGDIDRLAEAGITMGCNPPVNDRFCPERSVTRGEAAAFFVRALGLEQTTDDCFVDDDGSIFEGDIDRLFTAGITAGCGPADAPRFLPDAPLKRGQAAAFFHRADPLRL